MIKLKSHYKKLEVEEEKVINSINNRATSNFSHNANV